MTTSRSTGADDPTITDTSTTEVYAATYATENDRGEFGVDLVGQEVERDADEAALHHRTAGWDWYVGPAYGTWSPDDADDLLLTLGWVRVAAWTFFTDPGGVPGWTVRVERKDES